MSVIPSIVLTHSVSSNVAVLIVRKRFYYLSVVPRIVSARTARKISWYLMYIRNFHVCLSYHGWYTHSVRRSVLVLNIRKKIFGLSVVPWIEITCSTRNNFLVQKVRKKISCHSDVRIVSSMTRSLQKKNPNPKIKIFSCQTSTGSLHKFL